TLTERFLTLFGGFTNPTGGYSNAAARFALLYLLGEDWSRSGFDASTMRYSRMIILWGANVLEARLGSEIPARLMEAKKRGATIVVIDPRRSVTAARAGTWWVPVMPGTDSALMLAILHVLFSEGLADRDCMERLGSGFGFLEEYAMECTPEWAESICGVPAAEISRLARAWAAAKPAMLLPGYSIQRTFAGEDTYRLSAALQLATGNFGIRGGSTGSLNNRLPVPRIGRIGVPDGTGAVIREVPSSRWADLVLEGSAGGYPSDIHAIYSAGGNFLNQGADINKNRAAFEKADFIVSHDFFLTPTAKWSDVVLPAATALEKEDIGIPWLGNYLLYKPQSMAPRGQARSDYDIFRDLARRLGFGERFSEGMNAAGWVQKCIAESEIDDPEAFMRSGIYRGKEQDRVGLSDFAADPAGHPLKTPSGKVEIASEAYKRDTGCPVIPVWKAPPSNPSFPLLLVTPKSTHRTHSQGSNIERIREKAAHALEMHPDDAAKRGISEGDTVLVFNSSGKSRISVSLTRDIVAGVVCLHEGAWYDPDGDGVDQAGSANMFTSTSGTEASRASIMHAIRVEVMRH
ncbi:MAG: molybdopterin-dependent oxidoreductase, partial [Rectinemataceae bacterium]|nr:molybdopterin-dependent oxidoreductase [Rectinemataceae bacterium]